MNDTQCCQPDSIRTRSKCWLKEPRDKCVVVPKPGQQDPYEVTQRPTRGFNRSNFPGRWIQSHELNGAINDKVTGSRGTLMNESSK